MKRWLILLLALLPLLASAETISLPSKPNNRVSDEDDIFDPKTRTFLSQKLKEEYARNKISTYIVALSQTEKGQETATANKLRDAWIKEPIGLLVLFNRGSDKIAISLTDGAYKRVAAGGRLEQLASEIDDFNEDGPSRGMPKVIDLLLERLRVDRKPIVIIQEREMPRALIFIPIGLVLVFCGWGLFKLYRYMAVQNVFTPVYQLKPEPVTPVLGSTTGGVNTAEGKF
ncbi:MAG: TPM domain-containing protein [Chthoniobacterales bacterium]